MPYIKVKPDALWDTAEDFDRIVRKIDDIESDFIKAYHKIDWEVIDKADVESRVQKISQNLQNQQSALSSMITFLNVSYDKYVEVSGMEVEDRTPKKGSDTYSDSAMKKVKSKNPFEQLSDSWNDFKEGVQETYEDITEGVEEVVDTIHDGIEDLKEGAEEAVDNFQEGAKTVVDNIVDGAQEIAEDIQEGAEYVIDGIGHVTQEVYEWLTSVAEKYQVPLTMAYQLYKVFQSYKIPVGALSLFDSSFKIFGFSNVVMYMIDNYPTAEEHYNRNENMKSYTIPQSPEEALNMGWKDGVAANCHQFSSSDKSNEKWVSPDGKCEVIFNSEGEVVTDTRDYGTYNYADPTTDPLGHFVKDVLPWIVMGNTPNDTTTWEERMAGLAGL